MYDLPIGYPAMAEGENRVRGFLMTFSDFNILVNLDLLEDYQAQRDRRLNLYYRRLVAVYGLEDKSITQAWAYFMTPDKIAQFSGKLIESGWWVGN